jgi:hypothetical protein
MALLRPATNTIPIVFVVVNDPVGQGFIPNLAHPGSNVTGFSFIEPEIVGKWINLLADVRPDLSRVALMFNPDPQPTIMLSFARSKHWRSNPESRWMQRPCGAQLTSSELSPSWVATSTQV